MNFQKKKNRSSRMKLYEPHNVEFQTTTSIEIGIEYVDR